MRRLLTAAVTLLAAATTVVAQADPKDVVKKAIDAHGGADALNKAKIAKSVGTGTFVAQGQDVAFTVTSVYSVPDKFCMEITADVAGLKLNSLQILNGKKSKVKVTLGGSDQPVNEKVKEEAVQAGLLQEVTVLTPLLDGKYTLKAEKDAMLAGGPASVVLVTGNGLRDVRLFIDQKTNRLVQIQRKGVAAGAAGVIEVNEETTFTDYKPVSGALLPMQSTVTHDGKKFMTLKVTDWKLLDKADDASFAVDN